MERVYIQYNRDGSQLCRCNYYRKSNCSSRFKFISENETAIIIFESHNHLINENQPSQLSAYRRNELIDWIEKNPEEERTTVIQNELNKGLADSERRDPRYLLISEQLSKKKRTITQKCWIHGSIWQQGLI